MEIELQPPPCWALNASIWLGSKTWPRAGPAATAGRSGGDTSLACTSATATARAWGYMALTSMPAACQSRARPAQAWSGAGSLSTRWRSGSVSFFHDGALLPWRRRRSATTRRSGAISCRSRHATQAARICGVDAAPTSSQARSEASDITSRLTAATSCFTAAGSAARFWAGAAAAAPQALIAASTMALCRRALKQVCAEAAPVVHIAWKLIVQMPPSSGRDVRVAARARTIP